MKKTIIAVVRVIYAPGIALCSGATALAIVNGGHAHVWLLPLLAVAAVLSHEAEQLVPYEPCWNESQGDMACELAHAMINEGLAFGSVLLLPIFTTWSPYAHVWPAHWPLVLQWLLAIVVADAGITLTHWASHHCPLLWRLHAVHHSVRHFHGINGLVKHPFHQVLETLVGTAPLVLMGVTSDVAALLAFAVAVQLLLQHSNVDMRIGPLRHLWAVAPVHRFHHRKWSGIGDVNFGLFTNFWDRLLGTAVYDPDARFGPGDFGIGTRPSYPRDYLDQLMEPLRSKSRIRDASGSGSH